MKDFKGDEFKEHTKCISEEEKYSAKGFVAKPNKDKGARKQESWTETLQNLMNKPGLDPQIKRIVERIAAQTNVPRKKPKFINFVKNSMKISLDNANKVWNVVEEALDEFKQIAEANRQKKELEKKAENGNVDSVETKEETVNSEDGQKTKKKKKKNEAKADDAETNGKSRKRAMEPSTDDGSVKKKKKKNKSNGTVDDSVGNDESATANGNSNNEQEQESMVVSDDKFDWQSVIVNILSKKSSPMAIAKLKTKVVKKYAAHTSNGVSPNIEKKFLKKLKTTPNVTITNEFVELEK